MKGEEIDPLSCGGTRCALVSIGRDGTLYSSTRGSHGRPAWSVWQAVWSTASQAASFLLLFLDHRSFSPAAQTDQPGASSVTPRSGRRILHYLFVKRNHMHFHIRHTGIDRTHGRTPSQILFGLPSRSLRCACVHIISLSSLLSNRTRPDAHVWIIPPAPTTPLAASRRLPRKGARAPARGRPRLRFATLSTAR